MLQNLRKLKRRKYFSTQPEANISLIIKSNTDITRKGSYKPISLRKIDAENTFKIKAN